MGRGRQEEKEGRERGSESGERGRQGEREIERRR